MCIQGNIFVIEKKRGSEASRMVLPSLATFTLFVVAIFAVSIPSIEDTLIEQKKKQITALAQTTWSILSYFGEEVVVGNLSRKEGENLAKEQIRALRYGPEGKNYYWISDMRPSMVMHPYYNAPFCQDSFSTSLRCPPVATLLAVNLLVLRRTRTLLLESGNLETDETVPCCRTQNIF